MPDNAILKKANKAYDLHIHRIAQRLFAKVPEEYRDALTYRQMAVCELHSKQYELAKKYVLKSIALDPCLAKAYLNLVEISSRSGNLDEAETLILDGLKRQEELNIPQEIFWDALAYLKYNQAEYESAIEYARNSLDANPKGGFSHWIAGAIYNTRKGKAFRVAALKEFVEVYKRERTFWNFWQVVECFLFRTYLVLFILYLLMSMVLLINFDWEWHFLILSVIAILSGLMAWMKKEYLRMIILLGAGIWLIVEMVI